MPSFAVPFSPSRRWLLASLVGVAGVGLAGCTEKSDLQRQAAAGDQKNYVAGDGSVEEYSPESRGEPVAFEASLFSGEKVDARSYQGKVLVLNFWYAACSPCRQEAPTLAALAAEYKPKGVEFLGVNVRDEAPTAEAFDRTFNIPYPSVRDVEGKVLMAMTRYVPPAAVPTTLVIDRSGKVAARILGIADKSTLSTLIKSQLA